ncbi:MAG: WYL domain-containing protein [Coriobacteriales bacterium]|nr:WYL domain-containing protein [Coriobacteriales bacterium]
MPKSSDQKMKVLYLLDILTEETDDAHGLTMAEILTKLEEKGVDAERKSVYDDLDALRRWGIDIVTRRGKTTEYARGVRDFELPELMLLVDAVQSSRFLTDKKCRELIAKLRSLTSRHLGEQMDKRVHVPGRIRIQNESIYYNLDALQRALAKRHKVAFHYFDYDFNKRGVLRKAGKLYHASPVGLVYVEENYYLVVYYERHDTLVHYRVDRMRDIEVLNERAVRVPAERNFDIAEYAHRSFKMFNGEAVRAELRIGRSLISPFIDRFGKGVVFVPQDDETALVIVTVAKSSTFFGWLAQFSDQIKIEKPASLADEYKEYLRGILTVY